jgi:hypothetical protein
VIALLLWRRLPNAAGRLSRTLRAVLRDGDYLLAWPVAAIVTPPAALLLGVLLGALHPGTAFSSSLFVVLAFAAVAGLGAALGLAALVGYLLADLATAGNSGATASDIILRTDVSRLDSYLVLAGLVVVAPLVAAGLRQRTGELMRPGAARFGIGFTVAAIAQAVLAYFWGQAAAPLLRPLWTFWGNSPNPQEVAALREDGVWIAVVTLLAVAVRAALTRLAADRPATPPRPPVRWRVPRPLPWPVSVPLRAAAYTLLLVGLVRTTFGAAIVFTMFVGLGVLRYRVVPALGGYARFVERIPLVLRVAACCLVGYLAALLVVAGDSGLRMVVAAVPALLVAAFLIPAADRIPAGERGVI